MNPAPVPAPRRAFLSTLCSTAVSLAACRSTNPAHSSSRTPDDFVAAAHSVSARALRLSWRLRDQAEAASILAEVRSLAPDPWAEQPHLSLRRIAPNLRAVCFSVLPDGPDGHPSTDLKFRLLSRLASRDNPSIGPGDGLVESAAQILPPQARTPQQIVRVFGSHALLDGHFANGTPVAPLYSSSSASRWLAGRQLMDVLLRALPRSTAGW